MRQLITHYTDRDNYPTFTRTSEVSDYSYCGIENTGIKFIVKYNQATGNLMMYGENGSIEKLRQGATECFSFSQFLRGQQVAVVFNDFHEALFWLSGYSNPKRTKKKSIFLKIWDFILNGVFVIFAIPTVFFDSFCAAVVFIAYISSDTE